MHCLLAVSFTCVCLRLAFICWKGPNTIKCCPFQQIKANRKQTLHSAFSVLRSAFGVRSFTPAGIDMVMYPCRIYAGTTPVNLTNVFAMRFPHHQKQGVILNIQSHFRPHKNDDSRDSRRNLPALLKRGSRVKGKGQG